MSQTDLIRVCSVGELPEGDHHIVEAGGLEIGVLNVDGEYYAISNVCAHMGGPVCQGKVQPELIGEYEAPGKRINETFGDNLAIACPWHGYEYNLETGVHLGDDDIKIPTYDVVVEDDVIYVDA